MEVNSHNSWVPIGDFDTLDMIDEYHQSVEARQTSSDIDIDGTLAPEGGTAPRRGSRKRKKPVVINL